MEGFNVDVAAFVEDKKLACAFSNEEEFVDAFSSTSGSARTMSLAIDWSVHCPVLDGVGESADMPSGTQYTDTGFSALGERVRTLERHLCVVPVDKGLAERIRVLEDKVMRIEQQFPQVAQHAFNYARDSESSDGSAPRTSGPRPPRPASAAANPVRKRAKSIHSTLGADDGVDEVASKPVSRPSSASQSAAVTEGAGSEHAEDCHDSSLAEIQRRMEELRKRLQLQPAASEGTGHMEPISEAAPGDSHRTDSESDASAKRSPRKQRRIA